MSPPVPPVAEPVPGQEAVKVEEQGKDEPRPNPILVEALKCKDGPTLLEE